MVSEVMQEKVDAAVEKYLRGEELTEHEQMILAYTWFAAGCSSCGEALSRRPADAQHVHV